MDASKREQETNGEEIIEERRRKCKVSVLKSIALSPSIGDGDGRKEGRSE